MSQQLKHIFFDSGLIHFKWFDQLKQVYQLTYFFLCFLSDNVGIWEPNIRQLQFHLKGEIDIDEFLEAINSDKIRIEVLEDDRWWIVDYLTLQAKTLTPNNRPHVSYIEDLIRHGLLIEYARYNPNNVQYDKVYELENHKEIEDIEDRKKARKAFEYLESRGLVRPLKEACQTLARPIQDSKEKKKNTDKEEDQGVNQETQPLVSKDRSSKKNNGFDPNDTEIFGEPSLPDKAPFKDE